MLSNVFCFTSLSERKNERINERVNERGAQFSLAILMGPLCSSAKNTVQNPSAHLSDKQIDDYHQLTNLSPNDIRIYHRQFLHSSPTGLMTYDQFENDLKRLSQSTNGSRAMFKMIDKDNSGAISFQEYLLSMAMFSQQSQPEQQLAAVFDTYQALARQSLKHTNEQTRVQGLTRADIEQILQRMHSDFSPEQIEQLTDRYMSTDQNRNGFISKQEFIAACMKNVRLMEQLGHRDAALKDEAAEKDH